jgi:hypothetical protein
VTTDLCANPAQVTAHLWLPRLLLRPVLVRLPSLTQLTRTHADGASERAGCRCINHANCCEWSFCGWKQRVSFDHCTVDAGALHEFRDTDGKKVMPQKSQPSTTRAASVLSSSCQAGLPLLLTLRLFSLPMMSLSPPMPLPDVLPMPACAVSAARCASPLPRRAPSVGDCAVCSSDAAASCRPVLPACPCSAGLGLGSLNNSSKFSPLIAAVAFACSLIDTVSVHMHASKH